MSSFLLTSKHAQSGPKSVRLCWTVIPEINCITQKNKPTVNSFVLFCHVSSEILQQKHIKDIAAKGLIVPSIVTQVTQSSNELVLYPTIQGFVVGFTAQISTDFLLHMQWLRFETAIRK